MFIHGSIRTINEAEGEIIRGGSRWQSRDPISVFEKQQWATLQQLFINLISSKFKLLKRKKKEKKKRDRERTTEFVLDS